MRIKRFNLAWWAMLLLQVIIVTALSLLLKDATFETKLHALCIFNVGECVYLFIYKLCLSKAKDYNFNIWDDLPFYLCNLSTILSAITSFIDNKVIMGFVCSISAFGAVMAYIYPSEGFNDIKLFSIKSIGYYGYHGLLICSGALFITTGVYTPSYSDILPILLFISILFAVVHVINTILRKTVFPEANYTFTYGPRGNGLLEFFYKRIPINLVYLYCVVPIFGVYILVLFTILKLFI